MKRLILVLAITLPAIIIAQDRHAGIRIGGGYAHDFPGMNGSTVFAEYCRPFAETLEAAIGGKWSNLQGYPRTGEVKEFTKAIALDFNLYFLPLLTETQLARIGVGFSFSFYNIRRTYPLTVNNGGTTEIDWPIQDNKGRASGLSLLAEYEYFLPNSNISLGARGSLFKGYDYIISAGGFIGIKI